jgi:hypothetical protein
MQSPRAQMDARISAAVSAGTISSTDQQALSGALDSIDSALQTDRASGTKPAGGMKGQIDSLIQQQVDSGSLTDAQATELKGFFAQGAKGHHGHHHGGGSATDATSSSSTSPDGTDDATDGVTGTPANASTDPLATLTSFLGQLRSSNSTTTYDASATTSSTNGTTNGGLVLDFNA